LIFTFSAGEAKGQKEKGKGSQAGRDQSGR
jgi:hypothetical protein